MTSLGEGMPGADGDGGGALVILVCRQMTESRGPLEPSCHVPVMIEQVLEALARPSAAASSST